VRDETALGEPQEAHKPSENQQMEASTGCPSLERQA
jgi:hypothetical protein